VSRPKFFKIKTFQSRLGCVEIFIEIIKINEDNHDFCRDFLKKFEFPALFAHFEANFEAQNVNK
jgi:hypothetical protein